MHVHVRLGRVMRTTIEIADEQRAKLLELAARRGEKGFSRIVQEAIARYLDDALEQRRKVQDALAVLGTFDDAAVEHLLETSRRIRARWR